METFNKGKFHFCNPSEAKSLGWVIQLDRKKGVEKIGYAYYKKNVSCPLKLNDWNWKIMLNGADAGRMVGIKDIGCGKL